MYKRQVGGIKEKILAAKRAGIKEIIMSAENKKNIDEIQDIYLKGLTFHYVNDIREVFAIALTNEKVADPIDLSVKKPSQEWHLSYNIQTCLLYTSDAADDLLCVDLGGRRII